MLFIYIMSHLMVLDEVDFTENETERTCSNNNNPLDRGIMLTMSDKRSLESANDWLSDQTLHIYTQ